MASPLDTYYLRSEVSNSDLGALQDQLSGRDKPDPTQAYLEGSLLDAMITEQWRVNYFKRTLDDQPFTKSKFETIVAMKGSFWKDDFCASFATGADAQKITIVHDKVFNYQGFEFEMDVRCKWDLWRSDFGFGADIKSTAASNQREFEAACKFFHYPRQRAMYMNLEGSQRDVLIGVSKIKPHKVFKIFINRNCEFYKIGEAEMLELLFRYYLLFGKSKI